MSMTTISTIDRKIIESLLELYSAATGYAVGLYEGERVIVPKLSREKFQPYCRKLRSYPKARSWCDADHKRRGARAKKEGFEICHAGLFNYTLPIWVDGKLMGTLLCGQVRLSGAINVRLSLKRCRDVAIELGLGMQDRIELERLHQATELINPKQKDTLRLVDQLYVIQRQFYELLRFIRTIQSEQQAFEQGQEKTAHEFQIRLQPLFANGENLRRAMEVGHPISQRMVEDADEILNSAHRLNVLVQNLSLGLGEYDFKPCDLKAIVDESIALYSNEAERKGISFEIRMAEPTWLEFSPLHMSHVMNNLVCNAVKYSYKGTSTRPRFIRIEGKHKGGVYEITMDNYGIGVLPEEMDRIFEKGYRGILTRDEKRTGAGLGLSIAKEIVEVHGGTIRIASHNVGSAYLTRFTIRLPVSE
jgi:signal transduction histidine kinase